MGRQSIEVQVQTITGEERETARSQDLSQGVDDSMRRVLRAGSQLEYGNNLREGVDCQPEPEHLSGAAQPGSQFVQLEVRDLEEAKEALMQSLSVYASTGQPSSDGVLMVAEDTLCGRGIQPFSERRQHHCDLVRRGFQTVQGGVAPSTERGVASLTAKRLDPFSKTMLAIPNQGMNVSVCDAGVEALSVRTGEALCVYPLRCSPTAFHLTPRVYSRRRRLHTRREGAGEATGGAIVWGAWLEETLDFGVDSSYS